MKVQEEQNEYRDYLVDNLIKNNRYLFPFVLCIAYLIF